jgi:DNA-directed RNA polymerase subunit L
MNHEHWTEKRTVASKLRIELKTALTQRDALVEALLDVLQDIDNMTEEGEERYNNPVVNALIASVKESQ